MPRTSYIRWDNDDVGIVLDLHAEFIVIVIVLALSNNSPWVGISLNSDTLSLFRANESLSWIHGLSESRSTRNHNTTNTLFTARELNLNVTNIHQYIYT